MDWLLILLNLVLNGILLYAFQKVIDERSARRLEKFKLELFEQEIKFSKLHEVRIEVVAGIYKRLYDVQNAWENLRENSKSRRWISDAKIEGSFNQLHFAILEFETYFSINRLYVPKGLCEKLDEFDLRIKTIEEGFRAMQSSLDSYNGFKSEEYLSGYVESIKAISSELSKMITLMLETIERELREVLEK